MLDLFDYEPGVSKQTTDGKFYQIDQDTWWDTRGIDLIPAEVIRGYLDNNPQVGIAVGFPFIDLSKKLN